jgi:Flp pilus assembly protein TadD
MSGALVFEEHSSVLAHWFSGPARGATLVYLDAHLDLQFIDPQRIARLAACADGAALAQLESPHCFAPVRTACYGIEDFLYPAGQLGLIRRVVWVAPPHVIKGGMAVALRGLLQMEGVTIDDLATFRIAAGGVIEGRLLGLDLAICTLTQLAHVTLAPPLLFDIDADYFVAVPQDAIWCEPQAVVAQLRAVAGPHAGLTIARSVGSGFMPLQYRFVADYLAALWDGRAGEAAYWQRLLELMRSGAGQGAYAAMQAEAPECAAAAHALALAMPGGAARAARLAQAARLDPGYADDIVRRLGQVRARRQRFDLAMLMALRRELHESPPDPARAAIAWVLLGQLYTASGRPDDAADCDRAARAGGAGHPELALELAKLYCARGDHAAARPLLEQAAADDETRVGAWMQLSLSAQAADDLDSARAWAMQAARAAPAWPVPVARLAALARLAGDAAGAENFLKAQDKLLRSIDSIGARLSS